MRKNFLTYREIIFKYFKEKNNTPINYKKRISYMNKISFILFY